MKPLRCRGSSTAPTLQPHRAPSWPRARPRQAARLPRHQPSSRGHAPCSPHVTSFPDPKQNLPAPSQRPGPRLPAISCDRACMERLGEETVTYGPHHSCTSMQIPWLHATNERLGKHPTWSPAGCTSHSWKFAFPTLDRLILYDCARCGPLCGKIPTNRITSCRNNP